MAAQAFRYSRCMRSHGVSNFPDPIVSSQPGHAQIAMIAPKSLAGIHVFFPDPWPKKRHHKRRLLKPSFVHALGQRLAAGG